MTPERWHQIEEIFHEALDLPAGERAEFLSSSSGQDSDLKAEVEKLLAQFEDASSFIEQPLYDSAKSGLLSSLLDDSDDDPMVGKVLGNYRIEREIGRGGMGAVYEAFRADGEFKLRVALKVVKRGVDTDFVLRRFRNERQILAALDHPFITRLIDGGTTDDGRPYFVMEFIDGLPLYRYCDKNRLNINERLRLFCRVTEAVEYAHQKLIIHRDLKPSNIFIAHDGSPRLLDFGIAKLLDPELASDTLQPTATALRMMTVDYASPEQVRGEKVTTATDIYSLGVILFELLTARRPYRINSRSPHDVARAICDSDPYLPSAVVGSSDPELPVVKVNPSAATLPGFLDLGAKSASKLAESLRGDLDSIITKALRKEPAERYASIAELRGDIERHLNGEPIQIPSYYTSQSNVHVSQNTDSSTRLVAVLPLSILGPTSLENTDESYLTVGLADAIITRLASVKKLTVRPTSSITRYNEHFVNPFRAGLELGVEFVLDGRIRRFGERIRISLQLLDVKHGSAIWAGQFDEHLTDVLELEDAISEQVAAALIPRLTGLERQQLAKRGTNSPLAYEAYLRGRFYWNQFTAQSLPKAIEAFEKAIELDPDYALAYVGVSDFYSWANIYGLVSGADYYKHSYAAAMRALEIDDQLGEAYASLGLIKMNQFKAAEAERLIRRAIELAPNYPLAHEWLSAICIATGRFREGIEEAERSEELDPLSLRTKTLLTWTIYQTGDFARALSKAVEIIRLDENYPQGHLQRGYILCELGRASEGVDEIKRGMELMPGSALASFYLAFALAAAGRQEECEKLADDLKAAGVIGYVKPMFIALACVAAGKLDDAFTFLNTAVEECDPWLIWLTTDVKLEPLRSDERYQKLLDRMQAKSDEQSSYPSRNTDPAAYTSMGFADARTVSASEMPTLHFKPSFFRRHRVKFASIGILAVLLIAGYFAGVVSVSVGPFPAPSSSSVPRSIAVLPFENNTGDTANDYISDGMSEALIDRIANFPDIRTVSRAAAFAYRAKQLDPQAIGKELGVDSIMVGTLTRKGDEFTLKTELVSTADGKRLFTMYFVDNAGKILELQDEMVSKTLERFDLPAGRTIVAQKSFTENNDAFDNYLKGEYHRQKGTPEDMRKSIEFYKRALEIDPNYALAFQGLALAYRMAPAYGALAPQESYPLAKQAAMKALSIDPQLGSAHVPLASIKFVYDWDFPGAEAAYKTAIQLTPSNAEGHSSYANFLVAMGRHEEAINELKIAQQFDPLSLTISSNIAWALYVAGRLEEAEAQAKQIVIRDPGFARGYLVLGEIYQEQGRFNDSISNFQRSKQISDDTINEMALGHVYATAGRKAEAEKIAASLERKVMKKEISPFLPAVVYAGLDDKDKAFYWLEQAYQERSNWLTLLKAGRRLKNLRGDPRFDDLLKRIGFPV